MNTQPGFALFRNPVPNPIGTNQWHSQNFLNGWMQTVCFCRAMALWKRDPNHQRTPQCMDSENATAPTLAFLSETDNKKFCHRILNPKWVKEIGCTFSEAVSCWRKTRKHNIPKMKTTPIPNDQCSEYRMYLFPQRSFWFELTDGWYSRSKNLEQKRETLKHS